MRGNPRPSSFVTSMELRNSFSHPEYSWTYSVYIAIFLGLEHLQSYPTALQVLLCVTKYFVFVLTPFRAPNLSRTGIKYTIVSADLLVAPSIPKVAFLLTSIHADELQLPHHEQHSSALLIVSQSIHKIPCCWHSYPHTELLFFSDFH